MQKRVVRVYVTSVNRIARVSVELLNGVHKDLGSGSCVVQRLKDLIYLDGERFRKTQQGWCCRRRGEELLVKQRRYDETICWVSWVISSCVEIDQVANPWA